MADPHDRNESERDQAPPEQEERPSGDEAGRVPADRRFPSSNIGRPRIAGVEAGVAAGLMRSTGAEARARQVPRPAPRHLAQGEELLGDAVPEEIIQGVELPDWTDPPTREIPRVLLRGNEAPEPSIPGPVWRESEHDFEQDQEAFTEMVTGAVPILEHASAEDDRFDFGPGLPAEPEERDAEETARLAFGPPLPGEPPPAGPAREPERREEAQRVPLASSGRVLFARRPEPRGEAPASPSRPKRAGRNPVVATVTGLAIGAVVLVCFWLGSAAALGVASLVLLLAAAECFQALRKARFEPAALVGLVAAPGFAVAAYLKGPVALPLVGALAFVATVGWYLFGVTRRSVVVNASVTVLAISWIALLGSFAGLLLDPAVFPSGHGVAYLLGAIEVTVAYDVGGYAIGSLIGRHKMAPTVSPNKTWEGLIGGSLSAIVIALAVTSQMHPWTLPRAAVLGVVAAVLAPIGDLAESMIKRDLKLKDMGRLLPAHGGVLDRVDALLFVLPATYFLVRLFHG